MCESIPAAIRDFSLPSSLRFPPLASKPRLQSALSVCLSVCLSPSKQNTEVLTGGTMGTKGRYATAVEQISGAARRADCKALYRVDPITRFLLTRFGGGGEGVILLSAATNKSTVADSLKM